MGFRNFYINVLVRIVFIIATTLCLGLQFQYDLRVYTKFLCTVLIIIQVILLMIYLNRINREVISFLEVLNINDTSYRFSSDLKGNFSKLAKILNNTADLIINSRIEKEKQYQFLQFVIEQINVGLIAFESKGGIQFINSAFLSLLKIEKINNIEELKDLNMELVNKITDNQPNLTFQFKINIVNEPIQILVQKKQLKINNEYINLVSVQNITAELDKKELESWQKLIRVLTHEIMNSIAPITNLTYSIRRSLNENIKDISDTSNTILDAIEDIEIIEKRSESLMQFVENYRKLTSVGKLNLDTTEIDILVHNAINIYKEDFNKLNIKLKLEIEKNIERIVDGRLLEQAIINLLKNAIEALNGVNEPLITISLNQNKEETAITISDNGHGIDENKIDNIFIPFYTTKEKGTGIGLSFVKQIVNLHEGVITVSSKKDVGTTFYIKF